MLKAMLVASAVLPIEGRPARMIKSDGCSPPSMRSRSSKLVARPETSDLLSYAAAATSIEVASAFENGEKPAERRAAFGEREEGALGFFDDVLGVVVFGRVFGQVGDDVADADQFAAERQIVDQVGVGLRLRREGRCDLHQLHQINGAADFLDAAVAGEALFQRDAVGKIAAGDQFRAGGEDAPVHRIEEVLVLQVRGDAVVGFVVEQDRAQQRLLGLGSAAPRAAARARRHGQGQGRPTDRHELGPIRCAKRLRPETLTRVFVSRCATFVVDAQWSSQGALCMDGGAGGP